MTEVPPEHGFNDPVSPGRFEWKQSGGQRVLRVLGEVDLSNARQLLRLADEVAEPQLLIDLTEVEFMDSTGLATLVDLESNLESHVELMVLASSQIDRLLDLTGLKDHFDIQMITER